MVCTPNWVWIGVDVWRLDGLREGLAGVAEVGCCTDDQGAESEVGAPRVADIDLKGRLLALAKKRAKVLVSRSAVDAGAGTIADHIVDGLFECMLRDHGGWWMLGVDLRILVLFLRGALSEFKSIAYVGPVLVPGRVLAYVGPVLKFVRFLRGAFLIRSFLR